MTIPTNRMSYKDVYDVLDKVEDDPKGIRIPFDTQGQARYYQMRIHNARAVDRKENAKLYDTDHPLYNQSKYDLYQVALREGEDGTWFVYIEPKAKLVPTIESLSEIEGEENETNP